jgi:chromosome segregation ATPase
MKKSIVHSTKKGLRRSKKKSPLRRDKISELENLVESEPEVEKQLVDNKAELSRIETTVKNLNNDIKQHQDKLAKLQTRYQQSENAKKRKEEILQDGEKKRGELERAKQSILRKQNRIVELGEKIKEANQTLIQAPGQLASLIPIFEGRPDSPLCLLEHL